MDGVHDLGGMHGFGPIDKGPEGPTFLHEWERRMFGLGNAFFLSGSCRAGEFRHAVERMEPVQYLDGPYFEHWLTGIATVAVERGILEAEELERRAGGSVPLAGSGRRGRCPDAVGATLRFAVGDTVRVRSLSPEGHTRCPRYVRGRLGTVTCVGPALALPEVDAERDDAPDGQTYSVRFSLAELWGSGNGAVHVDLWSHWLETA